MATAPLLFYNSVRRILRTFTDLNGHLRIQLVHRRCIKEAVITRNQRYDRKPEPPVSQVAGELYSP